MKPSKVKQPKDSKPQARKPTEPAFEPFEIEQGPTDADDEPQDLSLKDKVGRIGKRAMRKIHDTVAKSKQQHNPRDSLFSMAWARPAVIGETHAPTPRYGHTITLVGRLLVVFGGTDGNLCFDSIHLLNIDTLEWSAPQTSGARIRPRFKHCAVAINSTELVVWGGKGVGNHLVDNKVFVLDVEQQKWTEKVVGGKPPTPRWGHSAVLIDGKIDFIGGHDGTKSLDELYRLQMSPTSWDWLEPKIAGDKPLPGSKHATVSFPRGLPKFILLGGSKVGTLDEIHYFDHTQDKWTKQLLAGTPPEPRSRHVAATVKDVVFIFGGAGGGRARNDVDVLNIAMQRWETPTVRGTAPCPRMDHAATVVDDPKGARMFIFGGFDGSQPLGDLYVLMTLTWRQLEQKGQGPPPRIGHTLTMVKDQIFCVGGATNGVVSNDVRIFDVLEEQWMIPSILGTPPKALVAHCTVLVGDELFIFGGGDGIAAGNSLMVFNTTLFSWEDLPQIEGEEPGAKYGCSSCFHAATRRIFIFGGYSASIGYSNSVHALDITTLIWAEPKTTGSRPEPRVGHSATIVNDSMFVLGGAQSETILGGLFVLDTVTMTWTEPLQSGDPRTFPAPRFNHTAVLVGDSDLYIFGGVVSGKHVGQLYAKTHMDWRRHKLNYVTNELYVLDTMEVSWWQPKVDGLDPGSRFRHSATMWGSLMVMFGGHQGGIGIWALDTGIEPKSAMRLDLRQNISKGNEAMPNTSHVVEWAKSIGLDKYARLFVKAEIGWSGLLQLQDSDLVRLGITALGPRKKIMLDLARRRALGDPSEGLGLGKEYYKGRYRMENDADMGSLVKLKVATDMKLGRRVTLRFVPTLEQFRRELGLYDLLRSDFVVDVLDSYEEPETSKTDEPGLLHCIVLEYSKHSLAEFLARDMLEPNERKFAIDRLGRMLAHLHSHSVSHGDFRASSVCMFDHLWKLVDLSAARMFGEPSAQNRIPLHPSPEQAALITNTKTTQPLLASPSTDVWALGCILVESFQPVDFFRVQGDNTNANEQTLVALGAAQKVDVPPGVRDQQARHLLNKMLLVDPTERANIRAVLRHAFFVGGLDTEQVLQEFSEAKNNHKRLAQNLAALRGAVQQQLLQEKSHLDSIANKPRKKSNRSRSQVPASEE